LLGCVPSSSDGASSNAAATARPTSGRRRGIRRQRRLSAGGNETMTVAQLDSLITLLRSRPAPATQDVADSRARFEKMAAFLGGAPDAKCEKVDVDGVPAEWVSAPGCDASRAVLYLHGGGYVIGSLNTHRRLAYDVSAASGARVLLIDYRL